MLVWFEHICIVIIGINRVVLILQLTKALTINIINTTLGVQESILLVFR